MITAHPLFYSARTPGAVPCDCIVWAGVLTLSVLLTGCEQQAAAPTYGDVKITSALEASDGLDLQAVGDLVKHAKDAEELEKLLNQKGGINNLDLNADGKVDFLRVTEYGDDKIKGFSLTAEPAKGEVQEVATIEIEKKTDKKAEVYVSGNEQIYGHHHHYHSSHLLSSLLLYHYMFRPHPFYMSPFGFGYYPRYYGMGYARVSHARYITRTRTHVRSSGSTRLATRSSRVRSPNHGRSAKSGIRSSLRKPSASQRAFRARNAGPSKRSGGFGSPKRNTMAKRPMSRPSSRFGGSRRSFGGGFRSGGFRSGGFRSRR